MTDSFPRRLLKSKNTRNGRAEKGACPLRSVESVIKVAMDNGDAGAAAAAEVSSRNQANIEEVGAWSWTL